MFPNDLPRGIVGMHLSEDTSYKPEFASTPWVKFLSIVGELGRDFSAWSSRGYGVVCRLRYGQWVDYGGTIPPEEDYDKGAQQAADFVSESRGCHIWEIGNEPNKDNERPDGEIITPDKYADYFVKVEKKIHDLPGHEFDWVVPAAVATWNIDTKYYGNESGDWCVYHNDMLGGILARGGQIDALAIHTYTHGTSPSLILDPQKMNPPFGEYFYNFPAFTDLIAWTPAVLLGLPLLITEMNQNGIWANTGWIREAYRVINAWNHDIEKEPTIWAAFTFRYEDELYGMKQHPSVMDEFHSVVEIGYTRPEEVEPPMTERLLYQTSFEEGFYFPLGADKQEVTIPVGWDWNHDKDYGPRPEYKPKDKLMGEPEVRTGQFAAGFFRQSSLWAGAEFKKFSTTPFAPVRFEVWCMGVHKGGPAAGMSCGIAHDTDFYKDDSLWQEWWSPNMAEYQDRAWEKITATGKADANGEFYVVMFARTDDAIEGWHTHWDDAKVFVTDDGGPIDPPVDPPEGGIMDSVTAIRAECDKLEAAVANPFLCIRY